MAKAIPNELKGLQEAVPTPASGIDRNAAIRSFRSTFDTSAEGTTVSDTLSLGTFREGGRVRAFDIACSTNMSAASIAIGTASDPDKYVAAAALPNASSQRRVVLPDAAGKDALAEGEELICTISGATIPAGLLTVDAEVAQR